MEKQYVWLDRACMTESGTDGGRLDTEAGARNLSAAYRACANWVAEWCGVDSDRVVLTTGTTDACDNALLVGGRATRMLIYTDLAHECTQRSVFCAADMLPALKGTRTDTACLTISDLFHLPPEALSKALVSRLQKLTGGEAATVVLEHITSHDGRRLPIHEISADLARWMPEIYLIVDGAQGAGIWRPPANLRGAYIGCFHKYMNGPVGTGFAVLPPTLAEKMPHRLRATRPVDAHRIGEYLPTTDISKWLGCAQAIASFRQHRRTKERVSIVEALRLHLFAALPRPMRDQLDCILPEYQSHILNFHSSDATSPEHLWRTLDNLGFGTKRTASGIRITLHDDLDVDTVDSFTQNLLKAWGSPSRIEDEVEIVEGAAVAMK
jgi:uncharacterized protein (DUF2249 family)